MNHALAQLQQQFDEEGSACRVRWLRTYQRPAHPEPVEGRFIAPSLRSEPGQLTPADRAHLGRALLLAALLILFFAVVTP